nr:hypothetical protein [Tanacetum cinerariifolium]
MLIGSGSVNSGRVKVGSRPKKEHIRLGCTETPSGCRITYLKRPENGNAGKRLGNVPSISGNVPSIGELRLKREAAERAFEVQAEKDRTLMLLEELRFLATSTKDLDDADAY